MRVYKRYVTSVTIHDTGPTVELEDIPSIDDRHRGRDDMKDSPQAHFELLTEEDMAEMDKAIELAKAAIRKLKHQSLTPIRVVKEDDDGDEDD